MGNYPLCWMKLSYIVTAVEKAALAGNLAPVDILKEFPRVLTRPAGRYRGYLKNPRVESGRVRRCMEYYRSTRVGSGGVWNITGRLGSGQEVCRILRVDSGRVRRCMEYYGSTRVGSGGFRISRGWPGSPCDPIRPQQRHPTREMPWIFVMAQVLSSSVCAGGRHREYILHTAVPSFYKIAYQVLVGLGVALPLSAIFYS